MHGLSARPNTANASDCAGFGASPEAWSQIIGALRAYGTRVGADDDTVVRDAAHYLAGMGEAVPGEPGEECRLAVRELHHRIKNELQVIISRMHRYSRAAASVDERAAWSTCMAQIASMASLHDLLVPGGSQDRVDLAGLLLTICDGFAKGFGPEVRIEPDIASATVATATAEALGLVLNEALTNAVKHGVIGTDGETIRVSLAVDQGSATATLVIANRRTAGETRVGFGHRLIDLLADRLGGQVARRVEGESYTLACTFPLS